MTQKARENKRFSLLRREDGQLTIFFAIVLLILITLLAFIINVGLFVKAKINLQNSVDAAAFAGAAVQARQLTTISHLNWEMRNTYKEWLFKYYVLGQLSLNKTKLTGGVLPTTGKHAQHVPGKMNFRQDLFDRSNTLMQNTPGVEEVDPYNAPSVCIHFGNDDICQIYKVPGIPRFDPVGLPGISEHHEAFVNVLDQEKSKDCSVRSNLNFMTALMWTYGTEKEIPGGTTIAINRPGAWVQSMELALRVRNMEHLVNSPPIPKVCNSGSGCTQPMGLAQTGEIPYHERTIKAFESGIRNLGEEMQATFALYELSPTPQTFGTNTLSGSLYPTDPTKYYLDLKVMPINYIMFYTTFVTSQGQYSGGVASTAQCDSSKTALPVPGYIIGFVKNPAMLTYYAVKGEARFSGLFFPFTSSEGILLKAYAAAKPFGGRIGPYLFKPDSSDQGISVRTGNNRSLAYISTLGNIPVGANFQRGFPIPLRGFWLSAAGDRVGGIPQSGANPAFGIPNMIYDYETNLGELEKDSMGAGGSASPFVELKRAISVPEALDRNNEDVGLYDSKQFIAFAKNIPESPPGTIIDANTIHESINRARRPTKYEALNYLIPFCSPTAVDDSYDIESIPNVFEHCTSTDQSVAYQIFAPLFGDNLLFQTAAEAKASVMTYISNSEVPIQSFIQSLKDTAEGIKNLNVNNPGGQSLSEPAARTIATTTPENECDNRTVTTAAGLSMAARFHIFFFGNGVTCQIIPLKDSLEEYWSKKATDDPGFSRYFSGSFAAPKEGTDMKNFMTAFMPGKRQGAGEEDAEISQNNPLIAGGTLFARRNFYSTKFVAMSKFLPSPSFGELSSYSANGVYKENAALGESPTDMSDESFLNYLTPSDLSEFGPLDH